VNELVTAVRRSSNVVTALRAAALRAAASSGGVSVGELTALLTRDAFSPAAALHALGLSPDPLSSDLLVDALGGDQRSTEHAAWALCDPPVRPGGG
jgi:hypothetical protein